MSSAVHALALAAVLAQPATAQGVITLPHDAETYSDHIPDGAVVEIFPGGLLLGPSSGSYVIGDPALAQPNIHINLRGGTISGRSRTILSRGTVLHVYEGIVFGNLTAGPGSSMIVDAGTIDGGVQADGALIRVTGGSFDPHSGRQFRAFGGSNVKITGGDLFALLIDDDATTSIGGGRLESLRVWGDALIDGGLLIGPWFFGAGERVLSGGRLIGPVRLGGAIEIIGNDFEIDGQSIDTWRPLNPGEVFSAVLADGTPLVISDLFASRFEEYDTTVTLARDDPLPIATEPISVPSGEGPTSLRRGETLVVSGDGVIPEGLVSVGGDVRIDGGDVGPLAQSYDTDIMMTGGRLGTQSTLVETRLRLDAGVIESHATVHRSDLLVRGGVIERGARLFGSDLRLEVGHVDTVFAFENTTLAVEGGELSSPLLFPGTHLEVSGGLVTPAEIEGASLALFGGVVRVNTDRPARSGTSVSVNGGTLEGISLESGTELVMEGGTLVGDLTTSGRASILGGTIDPAGTGRIVVGEGGYVTVAAAGRDLLYDARAGSTIELVVAEATLGGRPIEGLELDQTVIIPQRSGEAVFGTLRDGTPFNIRLTDLEPHQGSPARDDSISVGATLMITRRLRGCSIIDQAEPYGVISQADVAWFLSGFFSLDPAVSSIAEPTDIVNQADMNAFIDLFFAGCPS